MAKKKILFDWEEGEARLLFDDTRTMIIYMREVLGCRQITLDRTGFVSFSFAESVSINGSARVEEIEYLPFNDNIN